MDIICAPDKFKGSLTARQAAEAMARGIRNADARLTPIMIPLSDGGEGFLDVLIERMDAQAMTQTIMGPRPGRTVEGSWGLASANQTGIIETARAIGLAHLQGLECNPMHTTTYGVGELIRFALGLDVQRLLVGLGGSSTCDGGAGMLQALGARFIGERGRLIEQPITGGILGRIAHVDLDTLDPRLKSVRIEAACDVLSPLTGDCGTAKVFAPQKGAGPDDVQHLAAGMENIAARYAEAIGRDISSIPGGGAAGGLGAGLLMLPGARLRAGGALVIGLTGLRTQLRSARACLTGEGRLDATTASGKVCHAVIETCREIGVPVWALVGHWDRSGEIGASIADPASIMEIGPDLPVPERVGRAAELLEDTAARWARTFVGG
ncbi:MAG: glycerate kinase [Phycisphaeraceae bacterium]|nr:glycerate kinase [Phycisphaeraceae bacterium]